MTVRELISQLSTCDPAADCLVVITRPDPNDDSYAGELEGAQEVEAGAVNIIGFIR